MIKECFSFDVSSLCDSSVLFLRALSQPVLSDLWVLFTAGVRFDASRPVLSPVGDSVRPGLNRLVSGGARDVDRLLVTTSACTLAGEFVRCDWLHSVTRGGWLVAAVIAYFVLPAC